MTLAGFDQTQPRPHARRRLHARTIAAIEIDARHPEVDAASRGQGLEQAAGPVHAQCRRTAVGELRATTRPAERADGQQENAAFGLEHAQRLVQQRIDIGHHLDGMLQHDAIDAVVAQRPKRWRRHQIAVQAQRRSLQVEHARLDHTQATGA